MTQTADNSPLNSKDARPLLQKLESNIEKIIKGKNSVIRMSMVTLLAGGHILFEDVPGVGKTTLAHCLAHSISLSFQRIQGTSDLLPSDILGVTIFDSEAQAFTFRRGPIFANIVVVDEINRTTPKTQSALLEAMNTAQVSIDGVTHELPRPFMVIATQNPVDNHGTFPLPKSQMDRFMARQHLGYPDLEFERQILRDPRRSGDFSAIEQVLTAEQVLAIQHGVRNVRFDDALIDYIVRLVNATRHTTLVELGCSTRGAISLRNCAQAWAYLEGRDYCIVDDIKAVAVAVLAHRLAISRTFEETGESIGEGNAIMMQLLQETAVPL